MKWTADEGIRRCCLSAVSPCAGSLQLELRSAQSETERVLGSKLLLERKLALLANQHQRLTRIQAEPSAFSASAPVYKANPYKMLTLSGDHSGSYAAGTPLSASAEGALNMLRSGKHSRLGTPLSVSEEVGVEENFPSLQSGLLPRLDSCESIL
eukprot:SAG11_NODE_3206_length_2611_cov_1.542596_2_plen_154_part_00